MRPGRAAFPPGPPPRLPSRPSKDASARAGCGGAGRITRRDDKGCWVAKKDRYLVALDIGSTKTCALIAEIDDTGAAKFLAMGAAESKGSRKGLIVNLDAAV